MLVVEVKLELGLRFSLDFNGLCFACGIKPFGGEMGFGFGLCSFEEVSVEEKLELGLSFSFDFKGFCACFGGETGFCFAFDFDFGFGFG